MSSKRDKKYDWSQKSHGAIFIYYIAPVYNAFLIDFIVPFAVWIHFHYFYSNDPTTSLLPGASFLFLPLASSEDRRTPDLRGPASDAVHCSGGKKLIHGSNLV